MVGIVIVAHGNLAEQLIKTSEMIMGKQRNLIPVNVLPEDSLIELRSKVANAVKKVKTDYGVLILTDIFGGSPTNASTYLLLTEPVKVVTGINLSMLLETLTNRNKPLSILAEIAYHAGNKGIQIVQVEQKEGEQFEFKAGTDR
ncbi:PTS sugar transporter subunit IIA [Anaerobranca gottschalkii]|uniref:PTS system, mannose-specific IIA component n=1 Tax=Anaerobranca gottschalkii DSM 13577 TaxID=1120990 RepID=A0A1H9ZQZ6_9FIRM|nr:PTS sugar transporter subunit IIA [Anaerobranca gottschalkii]SES84074.1 PTS system, mannose-specific IIA component [Anaerobranca gottschalkii DSM 13577]